MKKFTLSLLAVATLAIVGCNADKAMTKNQAATTTSTPATQTTQKETAQGIWIDVRGADEFATGHLVGAKNITPNDIAKQITAIAPDKTTQINLYCRSGRRAEVARTTLLNMGYQNVVNHGGFVDIKDNYLTSLDK